MIQEVMVTGGKIRGISAADGKCMIFKGIPYAQAQRFRPPHAAAHWDGIRVCDTFGDICMQEQVVPGNPFSDFFVREFYPQTMSMSEDSLYLNIWTPARSDKERLPVMFWIHGGGLASGYGHEKEFDGEGLAGRDVIVVTINYRLGFFGCFAHRKTGEANGNGIAGNNAVLDQIAALTWVHDNIEAFGGDPSNVTIFGQSAGGGSVISLMACGKTKGLFRRAIVQSGFGGIKSPERCKTMEDAYAWADAFLEKTGRSYEDILAMPADELQKLYSKTAPSLARMPQIVVDGDNFKEPPVVTFFRGIPGINLMGGSLNGDDFPPMGRYEVPAEVRIAYDLFGPVRGAAFVRAYPYDGNEWIYKGLEGTGSYFNETCIGFRQSSQYPDNPMYVYYFHPDIPGHNEGPFARDGVAFHSAELWYTFGTLDRCWRPFTQEHFALADEMMDYWTNFAKRGDPNGGTLPIWEPFDKAHGYRSNSITEKETKMVPMMNDALKVCAAFA